MVDRITKALRKFSKKDFEVADGMQKQIRKRDFAGIDIRKLTTKEHVYRAKKGKVRIIFYDDKVHNPFFLKIALRNEKTYKGL